MLHLIREEKLISFPLKKYLEMEMLEHTVVLFLVILGTTILLSTAAVSIYIPTKSV